MRSPQSTHPSPSVRRAVCFFKPFFRRTPRTWDRRLRIVLCPGRYPWPSACQSLPRSESSWGGGVARVSVDWNSPRETHAGNHSPTHDQNVIGVARLRPDCYGLGGEASVRERHDGLPSRLEHAMNFPEELQGFGHVVHAHRVQNGVE